METKQNVGQATASLILGILSIILLGLLAAIPAVICGHVAQSKIRRNPERLTGEGKAIAGLVMGYLSIALSIFVIPMMLAISIPAFAKARTSSMDAACRCNLQIIDSAKAIYALDNDAEDGAEIYAENLDPYLQNGMDGIVCPAGGSYTLNPIGTTPECSIHGDFSD